MTPANCQPDDPAAVEPTAGVTDAGVSDDVAAPAVRPPSRRRGRRRHERGQVLVIVVVLLIVVVVMTLFLFDLQYTVRLRVKTQNGADAAALTAANWQGRSLNMIGEMNLLKASDRLLYGFPVPGPTDDDRLLQSMDLLSEMQARVTYVGPLVGYAASQQAAKANQMIPGGDFGSTFSNHVSTVKNVYPILFDDQSANHGFAWIEPYSEMLGRVQQEGIAAKTVNSRYLLQPPVLDGQFAWLISNPAFYKSVNSRNYCWFILAMGLDENAQYSFDDVTVTQTTDYFLGSEFLPLYVNLDGQLSQPDYTFSAQMLTDRGLRPLPLDSDGAYPEIEWATFDEKWDDVGVYDAFNDGGYLRGRFKDKYAGSGAAARMMCSSKPSLVTGRWAWQYGDDPRTVKDTSLGDSRDGLGWSDVKLGNTSDGTLARQGQRLQGAEDRMEDLRASDSLVSVAAAKPFGSLGDERPSVGGVVLPVFTDVRLIPVSLVDENQYDRYSEFYQFLVEYFGSSSYPDVDPAIRARWSKYVNAIDQFLDHGSSFHDGWEAYAETRRAIIAGPDGLLNTADDGWDPCVPKPPAVRPNPPPRGGGGGGGAPVTNGGGASRGGPKVMH